MIRILAIDDNRDNLVVLKALLTEAFPKIDIILAESGTKGIELCLTDQPDVVLLDLVMPEMDGFEVCITLKADDRVKHIPIIIITAARTDKESRIKALEIGADAFLAKPIDEAELTAQVKAMLRIKESEDLKRNEAGRLAQLVRERTQQIEVELAERKKAETELRQAFQKLEKSRVEMLDLMENLKVEIESRKKVETGLRESEEKYKSLFENMQEGFAFCKMLYENEEPVDFMYLDVNQKFEILTGLKNVIGKKVSEVIPGIRQSDDELLKIYGKVAQTGKPAKFEIYLHALSMWFSISVYSPAKDHFVAIFDVITERKRAEEAVRQREAFLDSIINQNPYPIWISDEKGVLQQINQACLDLLNITHEEMIGKYNVLNDNIVKEQGHLPLVESVYQEGKTVNFTLKYDSSQLKYLELRQTAFLILDVTIAPVLDELGKVIHGIIMLHDITERTRAEEALRENEIIFSSFLEHSPIYVFFKDKNIRSIHLSRNYEQMLGMPLDNALGKTMDELFPSDLAKKMVADDLKILNEGKCVEIVEELNGHFYETTKFPILKDGEPFMLAGFTLDITKRKQAEEHLKLMNERFSLATSAARLGVWDWDLVNNKLIWDDRMYELYGIKKEDFNTTYEAWLNGLHPDDRAMNDEISKQAQRGEREYITEFRVVWPGGGIRYLKAYGYFVRDADGNPLRMTGVNFDITERTRAETEKIQLEEQLRRSQKLEAIGTLAGGIAHDFNNILTPILGYTDMALTSLPLTSSIREDLQSVLKGALRAKELIKQILVFSRQIEQERKPLKLQLIVREAIELLRPSIPSTIKIRKQIDPNCESVLADPSQVHQVIMNLCVNAFQAMEEKGGVLTIELMQVNVDAATAIMNPNLYERKYVRLTVSDTGIGMDEPTQCRIFEPFFTTKAVDKGTGLGLSVVHGIVRSHGGDILVESQLGKGAVFHVYFPVNIDEVETLEVTSEAVQGGQESILVVDDEEAIANMLKKVLERLGYHVNSSVSSNEALNLFQQHASGYDLLISDLTMPNMTGLELAKEFHKIRTELPIILITGYGENLTGDILNHYGIQEIIGKPIQIQKLASMIRKILDK